MGKNKASRRVGGRADGTRKGGRKRGRTFGNSPSRLSDPPHSLCLALSLLIPSRAESPLENCTAIMRYIYGMCARSLSLSLSRYMYFAIPLSTCPCTAYPGRSHAELRSGSRWARAVSGSALYSIPCFVSMHSKTLSKGGVLTAHHSVTNSSM